MNLLRRAAHRFRSLVLRRRLEAEMAEEMRFHLEQRAAGYARGGLSEVDARDAARRRFGNLTSIQESARDARGWRGLELFAKDLRLALRNLRKSPGFAALSVLTLGLGIGANTSMFNALKTVMLKPLPYAELDRLDRIYRVTRESAKGSFSPADFLELRRAREAYGEVAAYLPADASLSEPGRVAELARAVRVSPGFFAMLGMAPQAGRDFLAGEDAPGRDRVVILHPRVWQRRFGGRPDTIGRMVRVDGEPHQIVGVLPAAFNDWRHLGWVDLFRPLSLDAREASDRSGANLRLIGRRASTRVAGDLAEAISAAPSGAAFKTRSRDEAYAAVAGLGERLAREFPQANAGASWRAVPLNGTALGQEAPVAFGMLIGLSGLVLLIACSNLANFLLARTMARARELAVRAALGASRTQLLRPLVAESLVLSLAGGAFALVVAHWAGRWLTLRSTGDNGEVVAVTLDAGVFGWALFASLITAFAFGAAPALFAMRLDLNGTLKSGGRGTTGGRSHQRFRQALIVGQFALAMVLLAAAGLYIRGLDDLTNRRSGWESDRLVTASFVLPAGDYAGPAEIDAFHRRAVERLEALPGVTDVCIAAAPPFFGWTESRRLVVEGRERPAPGHEPAALVNAVTPRYFETFGTGVLAGRAFTGHDSATAPRVVIVNQTMARNLFGDENPIGQRLRWIGGPPGETTEIVGVAADVQSVSSDVTSLAFQLYVPMAQEPRRHGDLAVKTAGAIPADLVGRVRAAMAELDQDLPLRKLQPADVTIYRSSYDSRVFRDMLTAFAVLGLGLACLGIYGVIARLIAQRTGEFAVRMAMGASVADIIRLVLGSGVRQALSGSALGLLGAFGVARLLAAAYPNMRTESPAILAGTTLLLVSVALLACWLPARRASRIDATLALRAE